MARDTALAWREISDGAPKDGTHFLAWCELRFTEFDEDGEIARQDAKEQFAVVAYWVFGGFVEYPFRGSVPQNLQFLKWMPLPPPPGTEPPQSINSELLEAAKEARKIAWPGMDKHRTKPRLTYEEWEAICQRLDTAISNAEKASSSVKAEREMGEGT